MTRLNRSLVLAIALGLGLPVVAAAQGSGFTVDNALAANGKKAWAKYGCVSCHAFGKRGAGPDLVGVEQRRSAEWLHSWLKETRQMLETDSTAKALLVEYKGVKMPQFKLTDEDINGLIHYIAQESAKKSK